LTLPQVEFIPNPLASLGSLAAQHRLFETIDDVMSMDWKYVQTRSERAREKKPLYIAQHNVGEGNNNRTARLTSLRTFACDAF
jgi:hypothetical protein